MGSQKSGWTPEDREAYLRQNGWEIEREAKGSHYKLCNHKIIGLAKRYDLNLPENIRFTKDQVPGVMPMCENPALGTWEKHMKQIEWYNRRIAEIEFSKEARELYRSVKAEFNKACKDIRDWKHLIKHRLKMKQEPVEAPKSYHKLGDIIERKSNLKMLVDFKKGGL